MLCLRKVVVIMALVLVSTKAESARNLTGPVMNPDCPDDSDVDCLEPWVIHVAGTGMNNTVHHLWGTHGAPTFLLATTTNTGAKLTVDWDRLLNASQHSLIFDEDPSYVFGFAIPYIILFNDTQDTGKLDLDNDQYFKIPSSDFSWKMNDSSSSGDDLGGSAQVTLHTTAYKGQTLPNDTQIVIRLWGYGDGGRAWGLPKLLHTPSSAQLDIVFDHFTLNVTEENYAPSSTSDISSISGFSRARWAIELAIVSSEPDVPDQLIKYHQQTSLDDEHTPGVFHLDELVTPLSNTNGSGGYLQWRPVSYMSYDRDINDATNPNVDNTSTIAPLPSLTPPLKASLAYGLLGDGLADGTLTTGNTIISFGLKKDGYYTNNMYTTWTVAYGEGSAPTESFSNLVIIVISVGVGVPMLLFLIGGTVIATRKCRRRNDSPSLIDDDQ